MAPTRTGSKRLLHDLNQSIVFNLIMEHQAISRIKLARKSGLPASTITKIVGNLVAAGLVLEVSADESSGGRRPVLLSINATAGYVVGVRLREATITLTICDLQCNSTYTRECSYQPGTSPKQVITIIAAAIRDLIAEAGLTIQQIFGVGIGLSGLIDSARGLCRVSTILGWQNVELGPALERQLKIPVRVDNDVNTLSIAEHLFGQGREADNFLLVTIGRGIGMGIILGGEIYRGTFGGAGEFGHMTVDVREDAPLCNCGKHGCLEALASDYGIVRAALGNDPGHAIEDAIVNLIARARAGEPEIVAIFRKAGITMGIAIANLINIFEPSHILIAGEGLRAGDLFLEPMRQTIPPHAFGARDDIEILICPTSDDLWARGAASLILHEIFQSPIYEDEEALALDDLVSQASKVQKRHKK
ncbi:xylose repressor protein [Dictyobacter sp. S3.2.2.5]|uniref:Xylose repressor protein n=1 Tax=Dictyobacter halimunensis TaxID=3026934 RepID=A0ABQ6FVD3_9CHLR|nr:xylose repressor protein [Dictyobacter sp. S3.2.2.5]